MRGAGISWLNGTVFVLLGAGLVLGWLCIPPKKAVLESLELEPLVGGARPLSLADLRGKVVLLNFWGTWCPPCREEFPHLVEVSRSWRREKRFEPVLVSCGSSGESLGELQQQTLDFLKSHPADVPIYADPGGRTRSAVREAVGFGGYPTTLLLDGEGHIRGHWVGYHHGIEVEIDSLIRELISTAEQAPAKSPEAAKVVGTRRVP